jgi:hypothetical protein
VGPSLVPRKNEKREGIKRTNESGPFAGVFSLESYDGTDKRRL